MPDVTTTLLAMYQQIIGGSSAREQSALEAECARRVITSGLTIAANGTFTVPGNVVVGGSLTVTGSFSLLGTLTVGTLVVTGNATIGGLLTVTGFGTHTISAAGVGGNVLSVRNLTAGTGNFAEVSLGNNGQARALVLQAFASTYTSSTIYQANGALVMTQGAGGMSIGTFDSAPLRVATNGLERLRVHPSGGVSIGNTTDPGAGLLSVTSDAGIGGALTVNGNLSTGGVLTVTGFGAHQFNAGGVGAQDLRVRNTLVGAGNFARLAIGNDLSASTVTLQALSSTWPSAGINQPDGAVLVGAGTGGLGIGSSAAAAVRFYTSLTERLRIQATGQVLINTTTQVALGQLVVAADGANQQAVVVQNSNAGNTSLYFVYCLNSASGACGGISQSGATSVTFNTTSDMRLKTDYGRATDLTALAAVVIHDFAWMADERHDRGIFAQEAAAVFPRAVTAGSDETTAKGALARPWMTDYSKFVPDLIVGWQQHAAELADLRAQLAQRRH
jgi:hypothetical protein